MAQRQKPTKHLTRVAVKQQPFPGTIPSNPIDFALVNKFYGYRNKEDKTNLPPGYLVEGSQNVLCTAADRVAGRQGYVRDGQADSSIAGVLSAYDWGMHNGYERHLRYANGKLQFRNVSSTGTVTWENLMTSLTATNINFADWWDFTTEKKSALLFVMGSPNIYEWSGGITTVNSSTSNTIKKNGTTTWAEDGFYNATAAKQIVTIGGTDYTYTGGGDTTTLTGVTPDASGITANALAVQKVYTKTSASCTSLPALNYSLIETVSNQLYLADLKNNSVYVSKVNDYTNFSFTSPTRKVGEGAIITLDAAPVGFIPQEDKMYITAGKDQWYETAFATSSDLTAESLAIKRLKTAVLQAARSQAFIAKIKNSVMFVNNEPTLDELGRTMGLNIQPQQFDIAQTIISNNMVTPQSANISDPIKNDFDVYDFTGGSLFYYRNYVYVALPAEGVVRIYNMIKGFWEAPQIMPISRFAVIDGLLYGHSSVTPETYKLFTGYNDNGNAIDARAYFSFNNYGTRALTKYFNEFYSEGYISPNTTLTLGIQYEIDGGATITTYDLLGTSSFVLTNSVDNSLGKVPLGFNSLGGTKTTTSSGATPSKFRWIKTFPRNDFYEMQVSYTNSQKDAHWEILAFGPLVTETMYGNSAIKD